MTSKATEKILPDDLATYIAAVDARAETPPSTWLLSTVYWRDFIDTQLRETGESARVTAALAEPPESIIPMVMKYVTVPLGGACRLIKCPRTRQPSVCALCPLETPAGDRLVCSGPTVQQRRTGLMGGTRTTYTQPGCHASCPYSITQVDAYAPDADDGLTRLLELVYPVLEARPDYELVDIREEYAAELAALGLS